MIRHYLLERRFLIDCIDMFSLQYSQNRNKLRKLLNNKYTIPDPISSMINIKDYTDKASDIDEINRLVREQIKINKLILRGKDILICMHMDKCHP